MAHLVHFKMQNTNSKANAHSNPTKGNKYRFGPGTEDKHASYIPVIRVVHTPTPSRQEDGWCHQSK